MSIIKLTDPRYCSPLDPPLIPTYPPPGREGRPVFSSNLESGRWKDHKKLGHAGDPISCVGFTPSIFEKHGHATSAPLQRTNYKIIGGIVPTCEAPPPPPLSFSTLGRLHPLDNRLRSRKCRGARAWLISRG